RNASLALLAGSMITLAALTADRAALGHGNNNDPNAIHACVDRVGGLRVVPLGQDCRAGESRLHWGIVGPQGPAGATGPQGPPGPGISGIDPLAGIACSREGFPGVTELSYAAGGVIVLTCVVNATEALLSASPTSLSFNLPGTKNVTITNTGQLSSGPLTVS